MTPRSYTIDRLFQDALASGLDRNHASGTLMKVTGAYSADARRQLSAAIAEVMKAEVPAEHLEVEEDHGAKLPPTGLDSAILKLRRDGAIDKIVFLRVKDTVADTVLPLLSLSIAAWDGDMTKLVTPAAQALRSVWTNLVTLTRDKDSVALDVYEALTVARAVARSDGAGWPTTEAIAARVPRLPLSAVVGALKRLAKLKLVEVAAWGGEIDDEGHAGNTWRVRL